MSVNFAPIAPGLRMGAVQIFDNAGNLVGSLPVYGIGQEPEIAFGPGAQTTVNTGAFTLSQPKGVLTDAAGNLFISDADTSIHRVLKIAPDGTISTVGTGLQFPQGIAEDGAGNFYIADNNLNEVIEVPAGCTSSACQQVIGANYRSQLAVAVDASGNLFFNDFLDGKVIENPAGCTSSACQTVVYNPGTGSNPVGLTLDSVGNLYVGDFGLRQVVKVPLGCVLSTCTVSIGTGWSQPDGIAVDAAGDVFVGGRRIRPTHGSSGRLQQCRLPDRPRQRNQCNQCGDERDGQAIRRRCRQPSCPSRSTVSLPPSFAFATTNVGSTSADSPQALTIQSIGNQPLTGSLALNLGGNFTPNPASTCGSAFPLAPGAICAEGFSFTPQSATFLTGTATVSDNTLNNASPLAIQIATLTGTGAINGQAGLVAVPNLVGQPQSAVATPLTTAGLVTGTVSTASSQAVPSGSIISQNPDPGTQVSVGSAVNLLVSSGQPVVPTANPLSLENNYFLTGDYVSAGVTLRGTGINGLATGTITIPTYTQSPTQGVPDGADIVDAFLYWETLENTATPSSANATFNNYQIVGQQIGSDIPSYTDGAFTGTLRAYRASVNIYLPAAANGIRYASGAYKVSLPDGKTALPLTEGASLVFIYRVLSPNFPLKSVVLYDGATVPTNFPTQLVQGFYDAPAGGNTAAKSTALFASASQWSNSVNFVPLSQSNQYSAPLNPANAYAAVILSTRVNNTDNDGILDAWKTGPAAPDFHAGQPGYYDVKTSTWVGLPGAKHGQKDLFVQLDYMCAAVNPDGSCDSTRENLFPSPDADGNDPLAMVQQAFLNSGVHLHLQVGNAVPESTCVDDLTTTPATLCQFPNQPGVVGWKNSLEFSKLYPRNLYSCISGGDCTTRFPYGQKDSYHYLLMGHSLAIPAWNTRYGTLTSIVGSPAASPPSPPSTAAPASTPARPASPSRASSATPASTASTTPPAVPTPKPSPSPLPASPTTPTPTTPSPSPSSASPPEPSPASPATPTSAEPTPPSPSASGSPLPIRT